MVRYLIKNYKYSIDPKKTNRMSEVFSKDPTYSKYSGFGYIIFPNVYAIEYEDMEVFDLENDDDINRTFGTSEKFIAINNDKYYKWKDCLFVAILIKNCPKLKTINCGKSFAINPFPINGSYEEKYLYKTPKDVILENCPSLISGNISPYAYGSRYINISEYIEAMDKYETENRIKILEQNVNIIMDKLGINKLLSDDFEDI